PRPRTVPSHGPQGRRSARAKGGSPGNRENRPWHGHMDELPPPPPPPPPGRGRSGMPPSREPRPSRGDGDGEGSTAWKRWLPWVAVGAFLAIFLLPAVLNGDDGDQMTYSEFIALV